jgi:hypothetical protein
VTCSNPRILVCCTRVEMDTHHLFWYVTCISRAYSIASILAISHVLRYPMELGISHVALSNDVPALGQLYVMTAGHAWKYVL